MTAIAAGSDHNCALADDGSVACWGFLNYVQSGTIATKPIRVSGLADVAAIAVGGGCTTEDALCGHNCALLSGGTVSCWGDNTYGPLGNGSGGGRFAVPVAVSSLTGATTIAAGRRHTCATQPGGGVVCWGENSYGQLGNGTVADSYTPSTVSGLTGAVAVAAGDNHTCALLADGSVACWGDNRVGALGTFLGKSITGVTITYSSTPVVATGITGATAITAGGSNSCALLKEGSVMCWGDNGYGHLGDGSTSSFSPTPVRVAELIGATAIAVGSGHSCAVLPDSSVACWGANDYGQLGNGTANYAPTRAPVPVPGLSMATAVAAGNRHSCALRTDGSVACWGQNSRGELGDGTTTSALTPVLVAWL